MQDERFDPVRVRYRWRLPLPVSACVILWGTGYMSLGPLRDAPGVSFGLAVGMGVYLTAIAALMSVVTIRFHFWPNYLVIGNDVIEIPMVFTRRRARLPLETIFEFRSRKESQKGRVLHILSTGGLAAIQQNHLPWGMRLTDVKTMIADRVEIATGTRPE